MSEYQLYQFQAIDAPLTQQQKQYLHNLSSRVQVTPYSAQYEYHYSDLPAELSDVLLQGFDLALYQANWGAIQLLIRLPAALVDIAKLQTFSMDDLICVQQQQDSIVLEISFHDEDGGRWIEDYEELVEIADIRAMLINGDYRPLYLAWLKAALWLWQSDSVALSMPIPAGFNHLDHSLQTLVKLLELDQDLIAVVAQYSPKPSDQRELIPLSSLSATESIEWLQRLLDAEPLLAEKLTQRLIINADEMAPAAAVSVSSLLEQAKRAASQRLAAAAAVKQQQRLAYLNSLIPKQTQLWLTVVALIEKKQTKAYDQAVEILIDLFELANIQNQTDEFKVKTNDLLARYSNRTALKAKLKAAQLL